MIAGADVVTMINETVPWLENAFDNLFWNTDNTFEDLVEISIKGYHIPIATCAGMCLQCE